MLSDRNSKHTESASCSGHAAKAGKRNGSQAEEWGGGVLPCLLVLPGRSFTLP